MKDRVHKKHTTKFTTTSNKILQDGRLTYEALGVFKLNGEHIDYIRLAKALNYKIFGRHETGIRNLATKEQLQKLYELESNIAFSIDMGFISTFEDAITTINK